VRALATSSPSPSLSLVLLRDDFLQDPRLNDRELEMDLELELEPRRLWHLRDLSGGEGLAEWEVDLRLRGRLGERERDVSEGVDLRRVP
jgi:hypothetical protein